MQVRARGKRLELLQASHRFRHQRPVLCRTSRASPRRRSTWNNMLRAQRSLQGCCIRYACLRATSTRRALSGMFAMPQYVAPIADSPDKPCSLIVALMWIRFIALLTSWRVEQLQI